MKQIALTLLGMNREQIYDPDDPDKAWNFYMFPKKSEHQINKSDFQSL